MVVYAIGYDDTIVMKHPLESTDILMILAAFLIAYIIYYLRNVASIVIRFQRHGVNCGSQTEKKYMMGTKSEESMKSNGTSPNSLDGDPKRISVVFPSDDSGFQDEEFIEIDSDSDDESGDDGRSEYGSEAEEMHHPRIMHANELEPKETNYVTLNYQTTTGNLGQFKEDIETEVKHWCRMHEVICFEVGWATPKGNRDRKLEHDVMNLVQTNLVGSKFRLCEQLNIRDVPRSIMEEQSKISGGDCVRLQRYFTPKFVDGLPHEETYGEHSPFWAFKSSIADAHEEFMDQMRVREVSYNIMINLICVKY